MSVFWCFILGPSGGFLNYFFLMRCHAGRIPIVNREKNTGPRTPPQKNVSKTTTTNRLYGFKKKSGRFFFQRFTLGKPKTFSRTTRQMGFFAKILLFFLFERSQSQKLPKRYITLGDKGVEQTHTCFCPDMYNYLSNPYWFFPVTHALARRYDAPQH